MDFDDSLKLALKIQFGLAPAEPTDAQLASIKAEINLLIALGTTITDAIWKSAVYRHCPGAGQYKYAGIDNSDLTALLKLANQSAKGK